PSFKVVAFFTQPYEPDISLDIAKALLEWAEYSEAQVLIKPHPRDRLDYYQELSCPSLKFVHDSAECIIKKSDVVVTRTSSVAKESIAYGTPLILARWSSLDKSVRSDYIVDDLLPFYSSGTAKQLVDLLNNKDQVVECASR